MELLSVGEAAAYLRLSERKLYSLVGSGRVPFVRLDGRLLFPRHLLDGWLLDQLHGSRARFRSPPVLAGSHDPLLEWSVRESGSGLALLTGGSGDGLRRLQRGEAMIAGLHIREPGGSYNLEAAKGLGLGDLVLIAWAERRQGLLLPGANPHRIASLADAIGRDLVFARRQSDAGTQMLLHQLLAEAGSESARVRWTRHTYLTETDLALAILDGAADVGVGIEAVARRFGLTFIPLTVERFDLALSRRDAFEPPFQKLLAFARTPRFAQEAVATAGYDVSELGQPRYNA
jgi:putative molybdopterin biosynthesis protein